MRKICEVLKKLEKKIYKFRIEKILITFLNDSYQISDNLSRTKKNETAYLEVLDKIPYTK